MKRIKLFSIIALMFLSLPTYAAFHVVMPSHNSCTTMATYNSQPVPIVDNAKSKESHHKGNWTGIASISCAFLGLFVGAITFGICAIIFGSLGLSRKRKLRGLALAGLILGIICVVVGIIAVAAIAAAA